MLCKYCCREMRKEHLFEDDYFCDCEGYVAEEKLVKEIQELKEKRKKKIQELEDLRNNSAYSLSLKKYTDTIEWLKEIYGDAPPIQVRLAPMPVVVENPEPVLYKDIARSDVTKQVVKTSVPDWFTGGGRDDVLG